MSIPANIQFLTPNTTLGHSQIHDPSIPADGMSVSVRKLENFFRDEKGLSNSEAKKRASIYNKARKIYEEKRRAFENVFRHRDGSEHEIEAAIQKLTNTLKG